MSRIRADKIVNRAGTGAPELPFGVNAPNGLNVTGIVTATSFRGDGSQLSGVDASTLKDGSDVKIQATNTGATVTGTLVATVTGDVTGNLTGDVTGNLTGNATGNVTGTATTATNLANAGNITTGTLADARFPSILPAISGANLTGLPSQADINTLTANVAMLGFKVAVNGSLSKYNLVDQTIDEFIDTSGIDSGATSSMNHNSGSYTAIQPGNYFGDGSDGAFTSAGTHNQSVSNTNGTYDADMYIGQYTSFNLQSGHTFSTNQACRGMLLYVQGDCTINGTIDMTARGASADPTNTASWGSAGSDGNTVGANGLQIGLIKSGSTQTFTNDGSGFNGCGTEARNAVANQSNISGNGKIYTVSRQGAGGGSGNHGNNSRAGNNGSNGGSTNSTGGGGSGATSGSSANNAGNGSYGSCWSGGSGGAGTHSTTGPTMHALEWGGRGGYGDFGGNSGGAGNPGGSGNGVHGGTGENGTGGLIIIICGGTISGNGTIRANGKNGGAFVQNNNGGGGGSGGGAILVLGVANNFNGTVQANGGIGNSNFGGAGGGSQAGGNGGVGYTLSEGGIAGTGTVSATGTLQSVDTTASSVPTKSDFVALIENSQGTAVLNTDIKAYVSRDSGTTFTQGTLVDEGTWGTNKKILAFHDLDISSQPSGTSMCYKIEVANQATGSKETKIHAVSHGWA